MRSLYCVPQPSVLSRKFLVYHGSRGRSPSRHIPCGKARWRAKLLLSRHEDVSTLFLGRDTRLLVWLPVRERNTFVGNQFQGLHPWLCCSSPGAQSVELNALLSWTPSLPSVPRAALRTDMRPEGRPRYKKARRQRASHCTPLLSSGPLWGRRPLSRAQGDGPSQGGDLLVR